MVSSVNEGRTRVNVSGERVTVTGGGLVLLIDPDGGKDSSARPATASSTAQHCQLPVAVAMKGLKKTLVLASTSQNNACYYLTPFLAARKEFRLEPFKEQGF